MPDTPEWLPPLVLFETYNGNWEKYLNVLYDFFSEDFITSNPSYRGVKLSLKRHPIIQGKEATFWHIISEGRAEDERVPDLRRCERIRWPRPIIENPEAPILKIWENKRNGEKRICLWLEQQEYLVILAERKGYILLWTAFCVTLSHQKRKLEREFRAFKAGTAP